MRTSQRGTTVPKKVGRALPGPALPGHVCPKPLPASLHESASVFVIVL